MKLRQGVSRNCGHQLSESLTAAVTAGGGLSSLMAVFKSLNLCLWVSSWGFSQHGIWLPPEWMTQDRARLQDSNKMKVFNNLCLKVTCHLCVCCVFIVLLFVTPMDCSLPGSSVHGIFQARILEWVAISSSRGSSWLRDQTCVSYVSCAGRQILYHCTTWEAHCVCHILWDPWTNPRKMWKGTTQGTGRDCGRPFWMVLTTAVKKKCDLFF